MSASRRSCFEGGTIHFVNKDAPIGVGIWHTITACKAPCDKSTGVAYPLADADVGFDSGELGHNPPGLFSDGAHPTSQGYEVLASALVGPLNALLNPAGPPAH